MDDAIYREKIRRLLALAESPNEHEARAALLKARALMAEHKLSQADFEETDGGVGSVKRTETKWTCSKRRDPWMVQLSAAVGEHYCCKSFILYTKGKQTKRICFIGLENDVDICGEIFDYAAGFVQNRTKDIKKSLTGHPIDEIRSESDSYGFGFIKGLLDAYEEQQRQNEKENGEWGLALTIPGEVSEALKDKEFKTAKFDPKTSICRDNYLDGYRAGRSFNPEQMVKEDADSKRLLFP